MKICGGKSKYVPPQRVSHWCDQGSKLMLFIEQQAARHHNGNGVAWRHMQRCLRRGECQFPLEELILFEHFIYTREVLGLRVSGRQVTLMFLSILSVTRPIGWKDAKGSSGWLTRWKCRFDIGAKIATRKKEKSLAEMMPAIAQFHRRLIIEVPRLFDIANPHPDYVCFPPEHRFYFDQVPLPFVIKIRKATLGRRRDAHGRHIPAWEKGPRQSGLDKRQATLQLCIRPVGVQVVPTTLIFRGTGKQLGFGELSSYAEARSKVRVLWQPKAWADTPTVIAWLLDIFIPGVRGAGTVGWVLLGMDNLGAHIHQSFKQTCLQNEIWPEYTPEGTTDTTAPADHHVGVFMKEKMQEEWEKELVEHYALWTEESLEMAGHGAKYRRILMVQWCKKAHSVLEQQHTLLFHAFTSTGWLCKMDKSDVHIIQVKGWLANYNPFDVRWDQQD